jgi:predicted tellurium resistance membrane protein TerC
VNVVLSILCFKLFVNTFILKKHKGVRKKINKLLFAIKIIIIIIIIKKNKNKNKKEEEEEEEKKRQRKQRHVEAQ